MVCFSHPLTLIYVTIYLILYRFYNCLQHAVKRETISNSRSEIKEKNNPLCTPKNQRKQGKARDPSTTEDDGGEQLKGSDGWGIGAVLFLGDD